MPRTWRIVVACLLTTSFVAAGAALGSAAPLKHARRAHQTIALSGSHWRILETGKSGSKPGSRTPDRAAEYLGTVGRSKHRPSSARRSAQGVRCR